MRLARNWSLAAGALLGGLAAAATLLVHHLAFVAANLLLHVLQTVAFALSVPGLLLTFAVTRDINHISIVLAALCNLVFWFGFGWLCGYLVTTLRQQIRILKSYLNP